MKPFDWMGFVCSPFGTLPSNHPFIKWWALSVDARDVQARQNRLNECRNNPNLLRYYYNSGASIASEQHKIDESNARLLVRFNEFKQHLKDVEGIKSVFKISCSEREVCYPCEKRKQRKQFKNTINNINQPTY